MAEGPQVESGVHGTSLEVGGGKCFRQNLAGQERRKQDAHPAFCKPLSAIDEFTRKPRPVPPFDSPDRGRESAAGKKPRSAERFDLPTGSGNKS